MSNENENENENECDEFKKKIEITNKFLYDENDPMSFISDIQRATDLINEMYEFAIKNDLIKNTQNPKDIDLIIHKELVRELSDPNISKIEREDLIENFRQLLIYQLHVLYIIICKPIIEKITPIFFPEKKIAINEINEYAKKNQIYEDNIPLVNFSGGKMKMKIIRKAYYKSYKNLYFMLKYKNK
jgi:hypothetical protein